MLSSDTNSRKRKQELSISLPTSSWTDFIYSSPSSPSNETTGHFSFDSFIDQHTTNSGTNSRRHSVAVGELDYHSFDFLKQDMNVTAGWDDLQLLLDTPSSIDTDTDMDRPIHKRTLSLRENNPYYATLLSPDISNNTNLFNQNFLDALVAENNNSDAATIISDMSSLIDSTSSHNTPDEFLKLANTMNTITPTDISNEISAMADWLLEQQPKKQRTDSLSPLSPTQTFGSSMSSNSPSPPITPMQSTSFGFENEDYAAVSNKSSLISTCIMQGESIVTSLKPLIQDYLLRPSPVVGERTVMVLTSRVAQKSYGTEKRFLCPPPTTILKGASWWTNNCLDSPNLLSEKTPFFPSPNTVLGPPKLTIHISGETISQNGLLEWQTPSGTIVDSASTSNISPSVSGRFVSKQLYINDADEKRKRVEVLAKIQLNNGLQLGTFPSKGIKVISKPSKKRQSVKNMELCIHHGTTVSLFNRIRSQTVSTKYLGVSNSELSNDKNNSSTCFVARTGSWDPFVVWIVDTSHTPDAMPRTQSHHHPHHPEFPPPPAIALQTNNALAVHYNQPVVLQCVTTGLVSPVMIIRKVDKGSMVMGGTQSDFLGDATGGECGDETLGDPVSQLHKVAFQIVQDPSFSQQKKPPQSQASSKFKIPQSCHPVTYLACMNDVVGMHKTTYTRHLIPSCHTNKSAPLDNAAVWDELMQVDDKKPRRRGSADKRRGSADKRRGSTAERLGNEGLEGACWTEDVSDAAVWTIVGTDCASYTFWTPSESQSLTMPLVRPNKSPVTPFPVVTDIKKTDGHLSISGENFTRDICIWFGDIKAETEYKSKEAIVCSIPDMQELSSSPTLIMEEQKKLPLLFVRGDGVIYRTNQFYAL